MRKYWHLFSLLSPFLSPGFGHAETMTPLKLTLSEALLSDSNLFRLPAGVDLQPIIGKPSASDTIKVTTVGFGLSQSLSLQQLDLNLSLVDYKYSKFDYLNTTSLNYNGNFHWSATPRVHGELKTSSAETANNFSNYRIFNQKNIQAVKQNSFSSFYDLSSRLSLFAIVDQSSLTNNQRQIGLTDYKTNGKELGLRYAVPTGSFISYALKSADGQYLNTSNNSNSNFNQTDNSVKAHWEISSKSRADFNAAYSNRTQANNPSRNFSGINSNANISFDLNGKSSIEISWRRDLYGYQTTTTASASDINFSTNNRIAFGPVWKISPKFVANIRYMVSKVDFHSSSAVQRTDNLRDSSLSLQWLPTQRISATASLQSSKRSSDLSLYNFNSNMASLSVQYSY
jgi:exopolysaccharide biosynthesis operon protein EpsL